MNQNLPDQGAILLSIVLPACKIKTYEGTNWWSPQIAHPDLSQHLNPDSGGCHAILVFESFPDECFTVSQGSAGTGPIGLHSTLIPPCSGRGTLRDSQTSIEEDYQTGGDTGFGQ